MSKATIHSNVREGQTVYGPGQEDELASVLSKEQIERLTQKGAISGFGKAPAKAEPETDDTGKTPTSPKAKSK